MKKKFDAVKFQRKIREKLNDKYNTDREAFLNELKVNREKRFFLQPLPMK